MMDDRTFLIWLHERLINAHSENCLVDYMRRLRGIIYDVPAFTFTGQNAGWNTNSMEELEKLLREGRKDEDNSRS